MVSVINDTFLNEEQQEIMKTIFILFDKFLSVQTILNINTTKLHQFIDDIAT
jgi:hypothetical protein